MARAAVTVAAACPLLLLLLALPAGTGEVPVMGWEWELGIGGNDEDGGFGFAFSEEAAGAAGEDRTHQLRRDTTPCSVRGASYYNCRPGAQANPYSRGCSAITRCCG